MLQCKRVLWTGLTYHTSRSSQNAPAVPFPKTRSSHSQAGVGPAGHQQGPTSVRAGGDQSQHRISPAGAAEAQDGRAAQREVFVQPWPVPEERGPSPEALCTTWDVWSLQPHRAFGMRSVETEGLVSLVSRFAECLQCFFQPTGTDDFFQPTGSTLSLMYRGEMAVQSFQTLPRDLTAKNNRLELHVLTPS